MLDVLCFCRMMPRRSYCWIARCHLLCKLSTCFLLCHTVGRLSFGPIEKYHFCDLSQVFEHMHSALSCSLCDGVRSLPLYVFHQSSVICTHLHDERSCIRIICSLTALPVCFAHAVLTVSKKITIYLQTISLYSAWLRAPTHPCCYQRAAS